MLSLAALGVALASWASPVKAAPVTLPIFATITGAAFVSGIQAGDVGQGSVTYDDSDVISGFGFNRFQITDLSITFPDGTSTNGTTEFAPASFGQNDRIFLTSSDGAFAGINLPDQPANFAAWGATDLDYTGILPPEQRGFNFLNNDFQLVQGTLSEVPLPAAAWLFLGGLAALAGIRRGRRREGAA